MLQTIPVFSSRNQTTRSKSSAVASDTPSALLREVCRVISATGGAFPIRSPTQSAWVLGTVAGIGSTLISQAEQIRFSTARYTFSHDEHSNSWAGCSSLRPFPMVRVVPTAPCVRGIGGAIFQRDRTRVISAPTSVTILSARRVGTQWAGRRHASGGPSPRERRRRMRVRAPPPRFPGRR